MRAARLHGARDLRVEELPDPAPAPGELLVRIDACGVCPTDVRKYLLGTTDGYPLNPGHEWVGHVEALGGGVEGWEIGQRLYGDTYAGYAELAALPVEPGPWSHGPLLLPEDLPLERAIFVEPFADCLHAVVDQARIEPGQRLVVVGGGQMGLQLVLAGALERAEVVLVEPHDERRGLGLELGAGEAVSEVSDVWGKADAVILSIGDGALVDRCVGLAAREGASSSSPASATRPGRSSTSTDCTTTRSRSSGASGSEHRRTSGECTTGLPSTLSSPVVRRSSGSSPPAAAWTVWKAPSRTFRRSAA